MPAAAPSEVSAKLAAIKVAADREWEQRRRQAVVPPPPPPAPARRWRRVLAACITAAALLVLPFVVLVRGAVYLYGTRHWPTGLALLAAAALTLAVVTAYGVWLSRRPTGRARLSPAPEWNALPVGAGDCGHARPFL